MATVAEKQRRKDLLRERERQVDLKRSLEIAQTLRRFNEPQRPLSRLVDAEQKIAQQKISTGAKIKAGLANTLGKGIVKVKDRWVSSGWRAVKGHAAAAGTAGLALATPWKEESRKQLTEHAFDWVIWIGLAYYLFDRYVWGFNNLTIFKFWINVAIAIFLLMLTFGKGPLVVALSVFLMVIWGSSLNGIAGFGLPYISESMIMGVAVATAIFYGIAKWKGVDVRGIVAVLVTFYLQTGVLRLVTEFFPSIVTSPQTNWLFLAELWPYWFIFGLYYGHHTEKTSKIASLFTFIFVFFFLFSFIDIAYERGGFNFFGEETLLKNQAALQEQSEKLAESRARNFDIVAAPATCAIDTLLNPKKYEGYSDCVEKKQNPPPPPSEEDLLRASKKDKHPRISLFFIPVDEGKRIDNLENTAEQIGNVRIEAVLTGVAQAPKEIILSCSVNNGGKVAPEKTSAERSVAWKETVTCIPTVPLKKGSNDVSIRAKWAQLAESDYPVYFMEEKALDDVLQRELGKISYSNAQKACKGQVLCLRDLETSAYRRIPEFGKMFAEDPNWDMRSRYDPEPAALIIGTEFPPVIPLAAGKEIDFKLKVANLQPDGRIAAIKSIKITMPGWIEPAEGCTLLEKAGDHYEVPQENLQADWLSVLPSPSLKEQKDVLGQCKLKITRIPVEDFPSLSTLQSAAFRATMDFDYELRSMFAVRQG
ncbi:hypothetical protein HY491_01255 [Candidatus Woesearchaeota archaeon]|nr:hypothetical protein [Candidatus Woesearchaeota archaeon]